MIVNSNYRTESMAIINSYMKSFAIAIAILLVVASSEKTCGHSLEARADCGYKGITQQLCEERGCCWQPPSLTTDHQGSDDTPSCFRSLGDTTCTTLNYKWVGGIGFDATFYDKMYAFFMSNIDIQGKGGVVAAPDYSTPGGSYYYHWMRDAALTMRTFMEVNKFDLTKVEAKMKSYVNWVKKVQAETDPQGYDIRINPKFELPNGEVYIGGWCRPQTDGPGLRSATLITFADLLVKTELTYVTGTLTKLIKYDLDWVMAHWTSEGCDLWEEVRSTDFYWGRAAYYYALGLCTTFFTKLNDTAYAGKCTTARAAVKATLDSHWTGTFIRESTNREKDGAVVHAFSSFGVISLTDEKVAKTMQVYGTAFCNQYAINQAQNKNGIPGILIGRYPGDIYAGGNPWQLLTAVFGKTFYQGATALLQSNGFLKQSDSKAWSQLLQVPQNASLQQQVQAMVQAGDAVMYRLYQLVKTKNGHIDEQMDKTTGVQKAAKDLTWSYANVLSAMKEREKAVGAFTERFNVNIE